MGKAGIRAGGGGGSGGRILDRLCLPSCIAGEAGNGTLIGSCTEQQTSMMTNMIIFAIMVQCNECKDHEA